MKHYLVKWEIDIWADTAVEAARLARKTQLNPDSIATVFDIASVNNAQDNKTIDLEDHPDTSDIPEVLDCSKAERGKFYRPKTRTQPGADPYAVEGCQCDPLTPHDGVFCLRCGKAISSRRA